MTSDTKFSSQRFKIEEVMCNPPRPVVSVAVYDQTISSYIRNVSMGVVTVVLFGFYNNVSKERCLSEITVWEGVLSYNLVGTQIHYHELGRLHLYRCIWKNSNNQDEYRNTYKFSKPMAEHQPNTRKK